jgi:hypothetical protein
MKLGKISEKSNISRRQVLEYFSYVAKYLSDDVCGGK